MASQWFYTDKTLSFVYLCTGRTKQSKKSSRAEVEETFANNLQTNAHYLTQKNRWNINPKEKQDLCLGSLTTEKGAE